MCSSTSSRMITCACGIKWFSDIAHVRLKTIILGMLSSIRTHLFVKDWHQELCSSYFHVVLDRAAQGKCIDSVSSLRTMADTCAVENLGVFANSLIDCYARYVILNRLESLRTICQRRCIDSFRSFRIIRRGTSMLVVFRPCIQSRKQVRLS